MDKKSLKDFEDLTGFPYNPVIEASLHAHACSFEEIMKSPSPFPPLKGGKRFEDLEKGFIAYLEKRLEQGTLAEMEAEPTKAELTKTEKQFRTLCVVDPDAALIILKLSRLKEKLEEQGE